MLKNTTLALSAIAATVAVPTAAQAQHYGYSPYGYQQPYYGQQAYGSRYYGDRYRCKSGTTGMIVGGAAGALAGREIERQSKNRYYYTGKRGGTTGAIIGAAVGALAGRAITRTC